MMQNDPAQSKAVDTQPSYYANSFPAKMREDCEKQWHAEIDPEPGHEPLDRAALYRGGNWGHERSHLWNFFRAVKTRKPVFEDAVFGNQAAIACRMANESYLRRKTGIGIRRRGNAGVDAG